MGTGEKRRICILCETWSSGGIEAFLRNALCHMNLSALEVDIVAERLEESIFTGPLKERGVRFYQLSGSTRKVRENAGRFRELLKKRDYDVVHLNAYQALSLGYLGIAKEAGVPVRIAHSHNTALRRSFTKPLKMAVHCWAKKAYADSPTCRWACSGAAARFLFGDTAKYTFIPNGIDVERFRFDAAGREEVRKELGLDGKPVIGHVGRLCYQKDQAFLLDVLHKIHAWRPESVLLLAGEGEDRPMLEKKARALGLQDSVIFCGTTDRVERLYWAMDVFAFPSRFEGLGIVAVEAQAAGLPVVCSEMVPREACISEGSFRQFPKDVEVWAGAINELSMEERGDSRERRSVTETKFDSAAVAKKFWNGTWEWARMMPADFDRGRR